MYPRNTFKRIRPKAESDLCTSSPQCISAVHRDLEERKLSSFLRAVGITNQVGSLDRSHLMMNLFNRLICGKRINLNHEPARDDRRVGRRLRPAPAQRHRLAGHAHAGQHITTPTLQGDQSGLGIGFVEFDLVIPPCCPHESCNSCQVCSCPSRIGTFKS